MVAIIKNSAFWDVTLCGPCKNFDFVFLCSVRQLLVMDNISSSPILVTLMMEAVSSSKRAFLTRATRHNIPEDDILYSHRPENLKSYRALTGWTL
jgi:hypothetical protein